MERTYDQMLTPTELRWLHEILVTNGDSGDVDLGNTWVSKREYCDEGLSVQLESASPQVAGLCGTSGYIGRVVITTDEDDFIEVRLDHVGGQLRELFVLFVGSGRSGCRLPYYWTERSHEVSAL
jgi:hypothetical protein